MRKLRSTATAAAIATAAAAWVAHRGHPWEAALYAAIAGFLFSAWLGDRWLRRHGMAPGGASSDDAAARRAALTDTAWAAHAATTPRPAEVTINGVAYGVRPLTAPVMRRFTELGQPMMDLAAAQGPLGLFGVGSVAGMTSEGVNACYDALYMQLACLLVDPETGDEPPHDLLGLYVPLPRVQQLVMLLGPGGA